MNPDNRKRLQYWADNYLPTLCKQISDAVAKNDTEWVVRHVLSLLHDTYKALQFATNTSQYDKYSQPKI